ncbi:MAG: IS4 family transposase [Nitrospirota bacterium]
MRARDTVTRVLEPCNAFVHATRLRALDDAARAAFAGQALTLTMLALGTQRATTLRHRVKCIDRLLGNPHLDSERFEMYRVLAQCWLTDLPQLLIVVDWSSITADLKWHWLRASVVVEGRSVTLYEEVHPQRLLANYQVHKRFVKRLAQLLPPCRQAPIILTDAGFRTTWFKLIAQQGWHWIGRIRNREFVCPQIKGAWGPAKALYAGASDTAEDLGLYQSARSNPIDCRLVRYKAKLKGRKHRYASGKEKRSSQTKKLSARQSEPWLLSCSPQLDYLGARSIVKLYAQRMGIEQSFRDTKSLALGMGMGLRQSHTHGAQRLQALLLVAHIAQFALRLVGLCAKAQQLHLQLMSTNRTSRAEISVMTLARRVIDNPKLLASLSNPWAGIKELRRQAYDAIALQLNTA